MSDKSNEELLAEIVVDLEQHGVIGEPDFDGLTLPQKAFISNKLDLIDERIGDLVTWLQENVPDGVDAFGLVELQLEVHGEREARSGEGE